MSMKMSSRANKPSTKFCCECGFRISGVDTAEVRPLRRVKVSRRTALSMSAKCTDCDENWGELPESR
jgi:hypothetical protein